VSDAFTPIKRCSTCHRFKALTDFYKRGKRVDDLQSPANFTCQCKTCHAERTRLAYHKKGGRKKQTVYLKRYGLDVAGFNKLLNNQDCKCGICKQKIEATLCVDHDHKTGKVRGLLCKTCNSAIGLLADNPEYLANAIRYLLEPPARRVDA
jgi:hypothetical protein